MREHLRVDTYKVFDEDDKNLNFIMTKNKLSKSESYRLALKTYVDLYSVIEENKSTTKEIQELKNKIENLTQSMQNLYEIVLHKLEG